VISASIWLALFFSVLFKIGGGRGGVDERETMKMTPPRQQPHVNSRGVRRDLYWEVKKKEDEDAS
jgi:hypothetical protein